MSDLLRRHGPKVAVGGLLAVNVALIGALALRDPVTAVPAVPVPTSPTTPTPTSPAGPVPSSVSPSPASPRPGPAERPVAGSRLLANNSDRVAWRAETTGCGGAAVVEVSTDGGRSWSRTRPGLSAIVRLKAYGENAVFAVGADARCRPTYAWISGPGEQWRSERARVADVWFRTPGDLDLVHAPGGQTSRPCGSALVDLAGLGTYQAAALCADGRIRTEAEGRSWRTVRSRSGAVSLNADDSRFVAGVVSPGCPGLAVQRFDSSGEGLDRPGRCRPSAGGADQPTAVTHRADLTWVWSGERVSVF